jgi:hypothetical protein
MLYILAIILGIVLGIAAGGKIVNLLDFRLKKVWLILLAFCIQISAQILSFRGLKFFSQNIFIIQAVVFLMLFTVIWFNRSYTGVLFVGAGCLSNALVMMLNGGKMPVSLEVLETINITGAVEIIEKGLDNRHSIINEATKLPFLADTIHPPSIFSYMMQVVSIGDLIVVLGIMILTFEAVMGQRLTKCFFKR